MRNISFRSLYHRIIAFLIVTIMLFTSTEIIVNGNNENELSGDFENGPSITLEDEDEMDFFKELHDEANVKLYVKDEVIIVLDSSDDSRDTQFYSKYSADVSSIETRTNGEIIAPVESIKSDLNIEFDVSEVKLLNPAKNNTGRQSFSIGNKYNNTFSVKFRDNTLPEVLESLRSNPKIKIAEPDYYRRVDSTPNDPYYSMQYALNNMNMEDAWDYSIGNRNVVVGIIDSGFDGTHEDLSVDVWNNPNYIVSEGICSICGRSDDTHGYNFTGGGTANGQPCGGTPFDVGYHGTHVAGIIGAKGDNNKGICGVNWKVSLAWLCVADDEESIPSSAIIQALAYANAHNIPITNNSYGGYFYSEAERMAIENYNGLFIAAAGNDYDNSDEYPHYPSNYDCPNIISVAATDTYDDKADFSNYGTKNVDVAAPGVEIYSTLPGNTYGYLSGTSMATPQVVGLAALIRHVRSNFNIWQIKGAICGTVQQEGKNYGIKYDGGIIDASAALAITAPDMKRVLFDFKYSGINNIKEYVLNGTCVKDPKINPRRSGYVFKGWYTSSTGGSLFNFNTPITEARTIYAHWETVLPNSFADKIPDPDFRQVILDLLNSMDNGNRYGNTIISSSDYATMASITELNLNYKNILDMTGINFFTGLKDLSCSYNRFTQLDISSLSNLKKFSCGFNTLSTIVFPTTCIIENLYCALTEISSIDVSNMTSLKYLYCFMNNLTSLDVSSCTNLQHLDCKDNHIASLNVVSLNRLSQIDCCFNDLTTLIVGSNVSYLHCGANHLTKLDISRATRLKTIHCYQNQLTVINVCNNTVLSNLYASNNEINDGTDLVVNYNNQTPYTGSAYYQTAWDDCPFTDMPGVGYKKAVEYVYTQGYMEGTTPTTFSPNVNIDRALLATVLYTVAGAPDVSLLTIPFTDVLSTSEYYDAVKWVYNNGVMAGTTSTLFDPTGTVDHETAAVIFDNYAQVMPYSFSYVRPSYAFEDNADISSWASSSVDKMYRYGIFDYFNKVNGDYQFVPSAILTRKDLAVLIRRFETIALYL